MLAAFAIFLSNASYAQQFRTLEETLSNSPEASYAFVRCAAFFRASGSWAGAQLPNSVLDYWKENVLALFLAASRIRANRSGMTGEQAITSVELDSETIAGQYVESFRRHYANTGSAWDGNEIWVSDRAVCDSLAQLVVDRIASENN
ncbi:hypothetical protein [Aestuariicoccus sp. MJ-SS9]|uniref:hypothetical protein n=1 Tax=Aestuariicoccus sp. MJ-SS9 TaxID=3079855 RepID=UPI00290F4B3D|nr:hypothetical protein [Aestuariicoccus sp. MJ-SS9]MDU8910796.1 hypothetical protein [Aestuariicoccus sp. MJ-SS9]